MEDEVHKSSTWVKVKIRIIKYYSSKIKSTAFQFYSSESTKVLHMYLSKKYWEIHLFAILYRLLNKMLYLRIFLLSYCSKYLWFSQNNPYMESRYIFCCWYGLRWREWCSNVHCKAYIVMYLRENRFDHFIFTSKTFFFFTCFAEHHSYMWHENKACPEVRKNI